MKYLVQNIITLVIHSSGVRRKQEGFKKGTNLANRHLNYEWTLCDRG